MDSTHKRIEVNAGPTLSHSIDKNPSPEDYKLHVHDNYEILCVVSGNVGYLVEGYEYDLCSGCIIINRPAEAHKLTVRGKGIYERYVLSFRAEDLRTMGFSENILEAFNARGLGEKNQYFASEFYGITPQNIFEKMFSESQSLDPRDALLSNVASLLCGINMVFRNKKNEESGVGGQDEGRRILDYVNKNLTEDISLGSVSAYAHVSESQLNRIFKRVTGTSMYDYVISKRLIMARELIMSGTGAVEACQRCGFGDYSAFYRLYKKRMGIPPSAVRTK